MISVSSFTLRLLLSGAELSSVVPKKYILLSRPIVMFACIKSEFYTWMEILQNHFHPSNIEYFAVFLYFRLLLSTDLRDDLQHDALLRHQEVQGLCLNSHKNTQKTPPSLTYVSSLTASAFRVSISLNNHDSRPSARIHAGWPRRPVRVWSLCLFHNKVNRTNVCF